MNDIDAMDIAQIDIVYGIVKMYVVSEERLCIENVAKDDIREVGDEHDDGDKEVEYLEDEDSALKIHFNDNEEELLGNDVFEKLKSKAPQPIEVMHHRSDGKMKLPIKRNNAKSKISKQSTKIVEINDEDDGMELEVDYDSEELHSYVVIGKEDGVKDEVM